MMKKIIVMVMLTFVVPFYSSDEFFWDQDIVERSFLPKGLLSFVEDEQPVYFLPKNLLEHEKEVVTEQQRADRKVAKKRRHEQERIQQKSENDRMYDEDVLSAAMRNELRSREKMMEPVVIAEGQKTSIEDQHDEFVEGQAVGLSAAEKQRLKNKKKRDKAKAKKYAALEKELEEDLVFEQASKEVFDSLAASFLEEGFQTQFTVESHSSQLMLDYLEKDNRLHHDRDDMIKVYKNIVKKYNDLLKQRKIESLRAQRIIREKMEQLHGITDKKQKDIVADGVRVSYLMQADCDSRGNPSGDLYLDLYFWFVFFKRCLHVIDASMQDPTGVLQQDLQAYFDSKTFNLIDNLRTMLAPYRTDKDGIELFLVGLVDLFQAQRSFVLQEKLPDMNSANLLLAGIFNMLQIIREFRLSVV